MPPRANWKGYLRLSLVSCPIALYPASSLSEKVSFNRINRKTGNRLKQQNLDSETSEEVPREDIARGYEIGKGQYLIVEDDELEAAVVAMKGDEVVGGLAAYELDKFEQDRREIYIYDLAVAESHRRRGVGTGLIRELRTIASERNAYVILVQADMEDGPAIAFYEGLGAKETAYHFDIEVPTHTPHSDHFAGIAGPTAGTSAMGRKRT
jgi:ribosomal protein S18 acetylase RimI-like enzyme